MNELALVGLEWLGAIALFLGFIVLLRYLDHRERMSMIERGLLPDSGQASGKAPRGTSLLRGGLITAAVGLAVTIGLYTLGYLLPPPFSAVPGRIGPWLLPGLIPTAVGFALVASYYLTPQRPEQLDEPDTANDGPPNDGPRTPRHLGWRTADGGPRAGQPTSSTDDDSRAADA